MKLDKERAMPIIKAALKEDIGGGDITTAALIARTAHSTASVIVNEDCVICGLGIAEWTMSQVDYSVRFRPNCKDGDAVGKGKEAAYLEGPTASILRAERTMINFLSFLSAIATRTRAFVDIAKPYGVKILDTRKTLPLLRYLEKYAVFTGGGTNHRMGLFDKALIKDNHISAHRRVCEARHKKDSLKDLIELCRKGTPKNTVIEIEVANIEEFNEALSGRPDIIMCDNMNPGLISACMEIRKIAKFKPSLEASGGITLDNIEEYAKTGVDMISVGSLTNFVKSVDMSLELL